MSEEEVTKYLKSIDEYKDDVDINSLKDRVKHFQRRRHLMVWHDAATICNHGHVLFTCSEVYDKAIHLTDEEAFQIFGKNVDVQETIEKPEIYMFARCPGNVELTIYSQTRMEDVMKLQTPLKFDKDIEVYDIMRFFKGDGPSCQFEAGHKKVGITSVGFVEFQTIEPVIMPMLHIERILH